jgi:hypothetical protein
MDIPEWPDTALAVLPTSSDARKIRIYASDPTILEAYLIFSAFSKAGRTIAVLREAQPEEIWTAPFAAEEFFSAIYEKGLNALTLIDEYRNFAYFDWDDRYFVVGGSNEFLSICHPMPLSVGRMHFDSAIIESPDKESLLKLWEFLAPRM